MERVNVTLDRATLDALDYLKRHDGTTASGAIRQAVLALARRNGWRPERRSRPTAGSSSEASE